MEDAFDTVKEKVCLAGDKLCQVKNNIKENIKEGYEDVVDSIKKVGCKIGDKACEAK